MRYVEDNENNLSLSCRLSKQEPSMNILSSKQNEERDYQFVKSLSYGSLPGSDDEWVAEKSSPTAQVFLDAGLENLKDESIKINEVYLESPKASRNNSISNFLNPEILRRQEELKHFYDLKLSKNDEGKIQSFIKDFAEKSYFQLATDCIEITKRGEELKAVHPMRFIGHILSDSDSCAHLKTVKSDSLKYGTFAYGFHEQMKEKAKNEDLLLYAPGFAEQVNVERIIVTQVIESKQYKDLIEKSLKS